MPMPDTPAPMIATRGVRSGMRVVASGAGS